MYLGVTCKLFTLRIYLFFDKNKPYFWIPLTNLSLSPFLLELKFDIFIMIDRNSRTYFIKINESRRFYSVTGLMNLNFIYQSIKCIFLIMHLMSQFCPILNIYHLRYRNDDFRSRKKI